jgi:hypothetical protein
MSNSGNPNQEPLSGLSLEALADELAGTDAQVEQVEQAREAGQEDLLVSKGGNGAKSSGDLVVDLGGGAGKIQHPNGDLTFYDSDSSYTQTLRDGGYFRVSTEFGEVIFHLRPDGDIDVIAPNFDETLRKVNAGAGIYFWTNADGTIRITYDEQRGFSTSSVDKSNFV